MKKLKITVQGTGINEEIVGTDHEILPYAAGTYHKITLVSGTVLYINDFGIRKVWVEKLP